jgi:hypothetical protein
VSNERENPANLARTKGRSQLFLLGLMSFLLVATVIGQAYGRSTLEPAPVESARLDTRSVAATSDISASLPPSSAHAGGTQPAPARHFGAEPLLLLLLGSALFCASSGVTMLVSRSKTE